MKIDKWEVVPMDYENTGFYDVYNSNNQLIATELRKVNAQRIVKDHNIVAEIEDQLEHNIDHTDDRYINKWVESLCDENIDLAINYLDSGIRNPKYLKSLMKWLSRLEDNPFYVSEGKDLFNSLITKEVKK